jgi:hypothetical protein
MKQVVRTQGKKWLLDARPNHLLPYLLPSIESADSTTTPMKIFLVRQNIFHPKRVVKKP